MPVAFPENCPDCAAAVGAFHDENCDVARCARTGHQRLSCRMSGCTNQDCRTVWSGWWPGDAECLVYGWYARHAPGIGWVSCATDTPGAVPDLNRLMRECHWDAAAQQWVRPAA
jgi:hypothetical protein